MTPESTGSILIKGFAREATPHGLNVCLEIHLDGQKSCTSGLAGMLHTTVLEASNSCGDESREYQRFVLATIARDFLAKPLEGTDPEVSRDDARSAPHIIDIVQIAPKMFWMSFACTPTNLAWTRSLRACQTSLSRIGSSLGSSRPSV